MIVKFAVLLVNKMDQKVSISKTFIEEESIPQCSILPWS